MPTVAATPAAPDAVGALAALIAALPPPSDPYAPRATAAKPAGKSHVIPEGGSAGVDRDGQVLNPSSEQRSFASTLNSISPNGRQRQGVCELVCV
jgi:hypothetical protein